MKNGERVWACMKKNKFFLLQGKLLLGIVFTIMFFVILSIILLEQIDIKSTKTTETTKKIPIALETYETEKIEVQEEKIDLPEYTNLPREWKGYEVIGKIEIPKLNLEKYILSETSQQALKVAVTKTAGPRVNEIGNLCIAGHNYTQTFGRLKELEKGDILILTDTYERKITYQVYETSKVLPTDTSCLSQETKGEKEVTLITCTLGAIKRQIIKAIEVYD